MRGLMINHPHVYIYMRRCGQGRFLKKPALPFTADQPGVELDVVWHVCSDHLLMSLLTGMGGAGCANPCFLCDWSRDHPDGLRQDSQPRSLECTRRQAEFRAKCVQPIFIAEEQKSSVKKGKRGDACYRCSRQGAGIFVFHHVSDVHFLHVPQWMTYEPT
jgi:hypothetical protein